MFILLCPSRLEGCSNASWYMVISLSTTCPAPSFSWCLRQREKPSKFRNVQNVQKRQRWELSISEALSWWTALHHRCVPVGRERASAGIGLLEKRLRECGFLRTWQIPDACFAASSVQQPDDIWWLRSTTSLESAWPPGLFQSSGCSNMPSPELVHPSQPIWMYVMYLWNSWKWVSQHAVCKVVTRELPRLGCWNSLLHSLR